MMIVSTRSSCARTRVPARYRHVFYYIIAALSRLIDSAVIRFVCVFRRETEREFSKTDVNLEFSKRDVNINCKTLILSFGGNKLFDAEIIRRSKVIVD